MHDSSHMYTCVHACMSWQGQACPRRKGSGCLCLADLVGSLSEPGLSPAERKGSVMVFNPSGGFTTLTHGMKGPVGLPGNKPSRCIHLPSFSPTGKINTVSKTPLQCHFTCFCKLRLPHSPSLHHSLSLASPPLASHPHPAFWLPALPARRQHPTEPPAWPGCTAGAEPQLGRGEDGNAAELPRPINKGTLFAFSLSGPVQIFTAPVTRAGSTGSGGSARGGGCGRHLPCSSSGDLQPLHNCGN